MNLQEIQKRIDLTKPYVQSKTIIISSSSGNNSDTLILDRDYDFWCTKIDVVGYDSDGKNIEEIIAGREQFTISMSIGKNKLENSVPPDVFSYNKEHLSPRSLGRLFPKGSELKIAIDSTAVGTSTISASFTFRVTLHGYLLNTLDN